MEKGYAINVARDVFADVSHHADNDFLIGPQVVNNQFRFRRQLVGQQDGCAISGNRECASPFYVLPAIKVGTHYFNWNLESSRVCKKLPGHGRVPIPGPVWGLDTP